MSDEGVNDISGSKRHYLLPERLPEISTLNQVQLRNINHDMKSYFNPDFFYSGAALLSAQGKYDAQQVRGVAGKCLGGGVLSSRDLEWWVDGMNGPQPGQYSPKKGLFGYSKEPQSRLDSEWIAFEFGLMLSPPRGNALLKKWDEIRKIEKTLKQGNDLHICISIEFDSQIINFNAQANSQAISNLLEIAAITGVPTTK
jgi:hypothetical protein